MTIIRAAFLGDVVGLPGLRVFAHAAASLRAAARVDVVIVNGENIRNGSGITPELFRDLRKAGADAVTLGDHVYKERKIADTLDNPADAIARPANLAVGAKGKRRIRVLAPGAPGEVPTPLHIVTVLGRLFMSIPADDPFAAVDREVALAAEQDEDGLVIVEFHGEATSEKQAMAWHCAERWPGRVVAVVGTHTHVQTADARILDNRLAAMTDLGMCGGHRGVIGRRVGAILEVMTRQNPVPYDISDEELRACGCLIRIDTEQRRATGIEALAIDGPVAK